MDEQNTNYKISELHRLRRELDPYTNVGAWWATREQSHQRDPHTGQIAPPYFRRLRGRKWDLWRGMCLYGDDVEEVYNRCCDERHNKFLQILAQYGELCRSEMYEKMREGGLIPLHAATYSPVALRELVELGFVQVVGSKRTPQGSGNTVNVYALYDPNAPWNQTKGTRLLKELGLSDEY
jgi:hypothetical protein